MWDLLETIKTKIDAISTVATVKIGLETGISAKDCPAVRIVTEYSEAMDRPAGFDSGAIQIILLLDLKNDLEAVYEDSIALEILIRNALNSTVKFKRTEYDQDSITKFKASILHYEFTGLSSGVTQCN